ncbi:hypothetical protein CONCODRAFT_108829 [Conidiobolus coronatus NRRL 28638]|uniref:Uncharacterized protein n=1 Tax=Conidiobolus coronatus (strain ATCC 28846 / CBS 209.66 / NRRL 28638) TaxID=796925 RepID=A0A137PF08_CONC2|nr:hypothetical protein CONCODRAFT_108829 [Conidiobolus coronatus NRRL 28638]|eukprot:KXN73555.1 hypothetical protein CONCODRAFT_108829 [Conidiobolus coronatus NRRL 28638]
MSGNNRQSRYGNFTKSGKSTMVIRNEKHSKHKLSNTEATEELFTRHSKGQKTNKPKTNDSPSQNHSNTYNKTPKKSPSYISNPFQRRGQENKKSTPSRINTRDTTQHAQHTPQDSNDEDYFEDGEFELESDQLYINNEENYDQGYGQEEVLAEDEYYQDENNQSYAYENGNYDDNGYQNEDYQDVSYQNDEYHNEEYQGEEYPDEYYGEGEYQDSNVVYTEDFQESNISTRDAILNTEFNTTNGTNNTSCNSINYI